MASTTNQNPADRRGARIVTATIVAGGIALAGGSAYASANSSEDTPAAAAPVAVEPVAAAPTVPSQAELDAGQSARQAFFDAGYTYDDAVALGARWNVDSFEAKAEGGRRLEAGETLPVAPGSSAPAEEVVVPDEFGPMAPELDAFFAAGYDYDDAVALGEIWNVTYDEAKALGGQKLLAGEALPVAP